MQNNTITVISTGSKRPLNYLGCDQLKFCINSQQTVAIIEILKGELQRQNKLISSQRPFKILQNETTVIKIGQAVLEIFSFKD